MPTLLALFTLILRTASGSTWVIEVSAHEGRDTFDGRPVRAQIWGRATREADGLTYDVSDDVTLRDLALGDATLGDAFPIGERAEIRTLTGRLRTTPVVAVEILAGK